MDDWTIRLAEAKDYDGVCQLYAELDRHHSEMFPELFTAFEGPARPPDLFLSKVQDPEKALFLAESNTQLVGLADVQQSQSLPYPMFKPRNFALLDNIYVTDSFRGTGLAKALFQSVSSWAQVQELAEIRLKLYSGNEIAEMFYKKLGFVPFASEFRLEL